MVQTGEHDCSKELDYQNNQSPMTYSIDEGIVNEEPPANNSGNSLTTSNFDMFDSKNDDCSIQKVESLIKSLGIDNVAQHLKVICSFPYLNDNIFPKAWSKSFADSISSKRRNFKKWNELKGKLIMSGLIVVKRAEKNGKWLKRHFRNFKIEKETD